MFYICCRVLKSEFSAILQNVEFQSFTLSIANYRACYKTADNMNGESPNLSAGQSSCSQLTYLGVGDGETADDCRICCAHVVIAVHTANTIDECVSKCRQFSLIHVSFAQKIPNNSVKKVMSDNYWTK